MWGTSSNYPSINSYTEAARAYNTTKPLRGRTDNFRPLDARSSNAKARIEKYGEEYALFCYDTEIVRYYPNGDVWLSRGGWCSNTTCAALSALSPFVSYLRHNEVVVSPSRGHYAIDGNKFILPLGGLLFKPDSAGQLAPVSPPTAVAWKKRVLKDKSKEVRVLFKDVAVRIKAYSAAFAGGFKPEAMPRVHLSNLVGRTSLTEEEIESLAWYFIPAYYDYQTKRIMIRNDKELPVERFWRDVYKCFEIIDRYSIDLPYGTVAE